MKKPTMKPKVSFGGTKSSAGTRTYRPAAKGKTKSPFGKTQKAKTQKLKG